MAANYKWEHAVNYGAASGTSEEEGRNNSVVVHHEMAMQDIFV